MNLIHKYWATFGGMIAVGILFFIFYFDKEVVHIETLVWIHFAILLLHQFEEYAYPGKFSDFYNRHILNKNPITRSPLNEKGILIVNIVLGWTSYLVAAIAGTKIIGLTFGLIGISILNGIMHSLMFIKLKKYNPGLVTGAFVLIPFGIYFLSRLEHFVTYRNSMLGALIFIVGTACIPLSIYLTRKKNSIGKKSDLS